MGKGRKWETERTEEQVDAVISQIINEAEARDKVTPAGLRMEHSGQIALAIHKTKFPGMTYEDGIRFMYDWLSGNSDTDPMED